MSEDLFLAFPQPGNHRAEFETVAALLNSVPVTVDQVERAYLATVQPPQASEEAALRTLIEFAEAEGLSPPGIAAQVLLYRTRMIFDALSGAVDLKTEAPSVYLEMAEGPITIHDLGYIDPIDGDV